MFDKSRKSFISGARGTYRVRDSSLDITPSTASNNNSNVGNGISSAGPPPVTGTSFASSTYRIARNRSTKGKKLSVTVIFLDDSQHTFEVEVITLLNLINLRV